MVTKKSEQADTIEISPQMIDAGVEELRGRIGIGIHAGNSDGTLRLIVEAVLLKAFLFGKVPNG